MAWLPPAPLVLAQHVSGSPWGGGCCGPAASRALPQVPEAQLQDGTWATLEATRDCTQAHWVEGVGGWGLGSQHRVFGSQHLPRSDLSFLVCNTTPTVGVARGHKTGPRGCLPPNRAALAATATTPAPAIIPTTLGRNGREQGLTATLGGVQTQPPPLTSYTPLDSQCQSDAPRCCKNTRGTQ